MVKLLLAAFLAGCLVLLFKPDYRVANNLESNRDYFPRSLTAKEPGT